MAKKKQVEMERTPQAFLFAVAGYVENELGRQADVWPSREAPEGVVVEGQEVPISVEFRAGKPYVVMDSEYVVKGLSDIQEAVKRTARTAVYCLPKLEKAKQNLAAVQAQMQAIEALNSRLSESGGGLHVSTRYEYASNDNSGPKKLHLSVIGVSFNLETAELTEAQAATLVELTWRFAEVRSELIEFVRPLSKKEEKT